MHLPRLLDVLVVWTALYDSTFGGDLSTTALPLWLLCLVFLAFRMIVLVRCGVFQPLKVPLIEGLGIQPEYIKEKRLGSPEFCVRIWKFFPTLQSFVPMSLVESINNAKNLLKNLLPWQGASLDLLYLTTNPEPSSKSKVDAAWCNARDFDSSILKMSYTSQDKYPAVLELLL